MYTYIGRHNGTLEILPFSVTQPPEGADKTDQFFEDLCGQIVTVKAGCGVMFSSKLWHRSGKNRYNVCARMCVLICTCVCVSECMCVCLV